ncbi:MAG: FadR/GntR family transcriptional regulator [Anaerolineae bacterium]|nr:FadR/GntR family transcriptional regulator [Anaerolineae bacterium]
MYSSIQPSRLYEQIVAQIQNRVIEGKLRPGDKLPSERELAEQFNVSRTAVREAVKALRQKGLVEIQAGKGTYITDVISSTSEVVRDSLNVIVGVGLGNGMLDLVQVREMLEPEIAGIAAEKFSDEHLQLMEQAVATMDAAMEDAEKYVEADLQFHLTLARATQNPLIPILLDPIMALLREQRMRIFLVEGGPQRGQIHHKRILEAVKQRNPTTAHQAMIDHLEQVRKDSGLAIDLQEKTED